MWFSFQRVEMLNKVLAGVGRYWKVVGYVAWLGILVLRWKTDVQTFNGFGAAAKADVERSKCFVLPMWHDCGSISSSVSSLSSFGNNFWRFPLEMDSESRNYNIFISLFPQLIEIRFSPNFETSETKSEWLTVCNCQNWWNIHFMQHHYTCGHLRRQSGQLVKLYQSLCFLDSYQFVSQILENSA